MASEERSRVVLDEGRWTTQRPGETSSEAMNRLTAGDGEPMQTHPLGRLAKRILGVRPKQRPHFDR